MKTRNFNLKIANPCHENWDKMQTVEKGKYCSSCTKVVMDFSTMSNEGIADYFKTASGKVCGKFRTSQLDSTYIFTHKNPFSFNTTLLRLSLAGILTFSGIKGFSQTNTGTGTSQGIDNSGNKKTNGLPEQIIMTAGTVAIEYLPISVQVKMNESANGKIIKGGIVTINSINKTYYANEKGIITVQLPDSLKNKNVSFNFFADGYEMQASTINVKSQANNPILLKMKREEIMKMGEVMMVPEDLEKKKKCTK
ncbi:MAG: hypothetical protein IAF38_16545 [Bacteroidia bacterium]|nr:hypothetical protein [Bacteroidia bacterium]